MQEAGGKCIPMTPLCQDRLRSIHFRKEAEQCTLQMFCRRFRAVPNFRVPSRSVDVRQLRKARRKPKSQGALARFGFRVLAAVMSSGCRDHVASRELVLTRQLFGQVVRVAADA